MRILMIGPSRDVKGGISTVVNNYYDSGLDRMVDVQYLRTMVDGTKRKKLLIAGAAFFEYLWKIRAADLLHVHMSSRASFYRKSVFIQLARWLNKKIIIHLHGSEFQEFYRDESSDRQRAYITRIFGYADKVIALSESWKSFLGTFVDPDKIVVVYNCVPVPEDFTKDHHNHRMLFLGRVGKRKGIFDLVRIMPEVAEHFPEVRLLIGGDGEIPELQQMIGELGLQEHVVYLGWITGEAKKEYLKNAAIYLLPSYNEGLPIGLLEAMSYKCASVTSLVGGIPEVIVEDKNGYMIVPGDTVKLKKITIELLENVEKRQRIGEQAYQDISDSYGCSQSIKIIYQHYRELLADAQKNAEKVTSSAEHEHNG